MRIKLILGLVVAGLAGILGYIGYQQHQAKIAAEREEAARATYLHEMSKHVSIATIYLGRAVDRVQGGEPMTNQQFAEAVNADI